MKTARSIKMTVTVVLGALVLASYVFAGGPSGKKDSAKESAAALVVQVSGADTMRLQGEQRFRANCGRCHAAPQKFPPRVMATVVRHMRVRGGLTAEDVRLVLFYMTQ
jgi:cytochrome c5